MEFHHMNGSGGLDRKTHGISQARLLTMISKGNYRGLVVLLCKNCHWAVTMEGTCPHESQL